LIQQYELNLNNVLENLSPQGDRFTEWQGNLLAGGLVFQDN
jgi:hypothetical protein